MAIRILLVALAYFASGWLGLKMPYLGHNITLLWLPTGIAVAALYRWGRGVWPGIFVASLLVNLSVGSAWPVALGIAVGNTLAPLVSAQWLRLQGFHPTFDRQRDVALFALASVTGMLVSASGGVACLYLAGVLPIDSVSSAWLSWWMGDAVGALLAGSLLLSLTRNSLLVFTRDRKALLLWLALAVPVAWFVFWHDYVEMGRSLPLAFLTLPFFAWAALRFGITGAALAGTAFSAAAAFSTATGHGTFALPDTKVSLMLVWAYMASSVLTGLLITAMQAERLQAQETLRESEENLAITLNSIGDAVIATDVHNRISRMNPAAERLTGWALDDALGRPLSEVFRLVDTDTRLPVNDSVQGPTAQAEGLGTASHAVLRTKDGAQCQIASSASPIRDASGQVVGVVLVFNDISEQYRAQQALAKTTALLKQTAELARIGSWELDLVTNAMDFSREAYLINEVDPAVGLTLAQATDMIYPDDRAPHLAAVEASIQSGKPWDRELRMSTAKGRPIWIRNQCVVVMEKGKATKLHGTFQDITERKQAEQYEHTRNHMLALLAEDASLTAVLQALVLDVQAQLGEHLCSILLLDEAGQHLQKGVAPSLPDFYNAALEGVAIGMGVGSCGTAAFTGERVIVEDIASHPYWTDYRELAARAGLAACWSHPITASSGQVLGTFAIYHRQISAPDEADLALIEQSGRLASIAIERKLADTALRQSELKFSTAFSSSPVAASIAEAENGCFIDANDNYRRDFGWDRADLIGKTSIAVGLWPDQFARDAWAAVLRRDGRTINYETIWMHKDGERRHVSLSGELTEINGQQCILAFATDITARKIAEEKINELAFFDPLTRLPNRTLLQDRLRQAMTAGSRTGSYGSLLFIDLDNFKILNDTLGHDIGDLLLQQVAQRIASHVREGDTVARLGGDEFVVVLQGLSSNTEEAATETEAVGEKILAALNGTFQLNATEYRRSTASIGATLFKAHQTSIDELMKQADMAMYQSKQSGRNAMHFFDPVMQTLLVERAAMETSLRSALEHDQFVLHYQAQVIDTGRVTGAEALVRWQHPEMGMVPPANFIPLAEETGLILPLGQWVLRCACTQLAAWASQPEMAHLTVAVNVSAKEFCEPDYVANVLAILQQTQADPKKLKLELTESLLVNKIEEVIEKMFVLRGKGVGFSLDDFGTGYSSLSYLKRLPLDQLKIDQSFVRDVLVDPNDAAIARTVVALAHNLGLGVIAEGVETQAQRDFLASSGCYAYQGYFFSRPLPVAAFEAFARAK